MNKDMQARYQLSCAERVMGPKIKGFARLLILGMWSFSCVLRIRKQQEQQFEWLL